jgi:hypothetical protein
MKDEGNNLYMSPGYIMSGNSRVSEANGRGLKDRFQKT